jgi:hypothetical protein
VVTNFHPSQKNKVFGSEDIRGKSYYKMAYLAEQKHFGETEKVSINY